MDFNTERIYEGLYSLFEDELIKIGDYISFTESNLNTYSNKIHELHLRICAEIENVLKIVITTNFIEKKTVLEIWDEKKGRFLTQLGNEVTDDYQKLRNLIKRKKDKDNLDKYLFDYPDFTFFFSFACDKFRLDKKQVLFLLSLQNNSHLKSIIPFELESGLVVPQWWTNYNKLKHDKTNNFEKCTLKDLIKSLGGLYILMNYFFNYNNNNNPKIEKDYWENAKNNNIWNCDYFSYPSKIYKASNSFQTEELCMKKMPLEMHQSKFAAYNESLNIDFKEDISPNSIRKECGIFHIYFDYALENNIFGSPFYKKHKYCKFNN